ncbi:hypothetical protein CVIRNUC_001386 [Coccomyxa viridis]|uniref:RRM domain-containing protein n=1 Tax=Coccomyxa viridis TaxID=1274662 RepID=A0AAV1HTX0_9CHLO|nr:hypothetical protein CVIRNUC_001386 [Coccomyxa viridis]
MADVAPNQTIYVNNLPEKIGKEDLKKAVYAIFSQFGKILDVVALKTYRLRGQAWVVFADIRSAGEAIRTMQGFPFFDKPMRITYAKTKSDAVSKAEGTYVENKKDRQKHNQEQRDKLMERSKGRGGEAPAPAAAAPTPMAQAVPVGNEPPNRTLFVQNLPAATTSAMLQMLFQQFEGYADTRMVEARPGIAFVDYQTDGQATTALQGLQGFKITPTNAIQISYQKR